MKHTLWAAVLSTAAALVLGGCGADSTSNETPTTTAAAQPLTERIPSPFVDGAAQLPGTYVGAIADTDAFVAVVVDGADATAFVCDGGDVWSWLTGTVDDGRLALSGSNGTSLDGTITGGTVTGQFSGLGLSGNAFEAATAGDGEGVFRTVTELDGEQYTLGWIVTTDGVRGNMRNGAGQSANPLRAGDDRDDRRDRQERQEAQRCEDLAADLARALATQQYLQSQPAGGVNPQAIALNAQEIRRLQAAQC